MDAIIGTAGWAIPAQHAAHFPPRESGSGLQRYASRLRGVEINSSFYRPHRRSTWERWAASVPADFQFSVKIPKTITHERKLVDCEALTAAFLADVQVLGAKLQVLLVQLLPSLAFDAAIAERYFTMLQAISQARIACEPRHSTWFEGSADDLLCRLRVTRVAADPARVPQAAEPGGWQGLRYWRLHGSPSMYRSPYGAARLARYAEALELGLPTKQDAWCVFDNTASGAAIGDALELNRILKQG